MVQNCKPHHQLNAIQLASEIVSSYVGNHTLKAEELPNLLQTVYSTLNDMAEGGSAKVRTGKPAVPIDKSVTQNYIICLEDGKKLKMLKRYLCTHYDLSPEEYRRKWGLSADYPMTCPGYAKRRSELAKTIGLGKAQKLKSRKSSSRAKAS